MQAQEISMLRNSSKVQKKKLFKTNENWKLTFNQKQISLKRTIKLLHIDCSHPQRRVKKIPHKKVKVLLTQNILQLNLTRKFKSWNVYSRAGTKMYLWKLEDFKSEILEQSATFFNVHFSGRKEKNNAR